MQVWEKIPSQEGHESSHTIIEYNEMHVTTSQKCGSIEIAKESSTRKMRGQQGAEDRVPLYLINVFRLPGPVNPQPPHTSITLCARKFRIRIG